MKPNHPSHNSFCDFFLFLIANSRIKEKKEKNDLILVTEGTLIEGIVDSRSS